MRLAGVALGILLIGCADPKNFPPRGGGGGGQGGTTDAGTDATATDALTDANLTTGKVCLVRDLRKLSVCDPTDLSGVQVTLGTAQATATDDGSFTIELPAGTGLTWQLDHPDFVTSLQQLGTDFQIPIVRATEFANLMNDNGVLITQQATIVVQVLEGTAPLVGATVASSPAAQFPTRYDGNSAVIWDVDATGTFGVAWLPGLTGTSATITVTPPAGQPVSATVPIQADAITFATIVL